MKTGRSLLENNRQYLENLTRGLQPCGPLLCLFPGATHWRNQEPRYEETYCTGCDSQKLKTSDMSTSRGVGSMMVYSHDGVLHRSYMQEYWSGVPLPSPKWMDGTYQLAAVCNRLTGDEKASHGMIRLNDVDETPLHSRLLCVCVWLYTTHAVTVREHGCCVMRCVGFSIFQLGWVSEENQLNLPASDVLETILSC